MERRTFLNLVGSGLAATAAASGKSLARPEKGKGSAEPLEKRILGRTGEKLSIIGLGGLVLSQETQERANEIVRDAVAAGVNYFDVAPSYGNAEERMGPALRPFRKDVFLACKTMKRDKAGAEEELNASLKRLETDHFDLYQLHALSKTDEVSQATGPDGALETFVKARKEGKVRFLGFSAHSQKAALEAMDRFDFDTVLFPVNFACFLKAEFGPPVIEKARAKKMGILALKGLARQPWPAGSDRKEWPKAWYLPLTDKREQDLGLRFTLCMPVTAAVPPGDARLFFRALEIGRGFELLSESELQEVEALAGTVPPLFKPEAE